MSVFIKYLDPTGETELATFYDFTRLEWIRKEGEVGSLSLSLPGFYPDSFWRPFGRLEIWRSVGSRLYLEGETIYFLMTWEYQNSGGKEIWSLQAFDANFIMGYNSIGRIVPYNDITYQEKVGTCDDLMKAIVRENMGALALDTTRDLSAYMTVQADRSLAASSHKNFAFRDLMSIFQELAVESWQRGTYLTWDIVWTSSTMLEFRTYVNQRGRNQGSSSDRPLVINRLSKSLEEVSLLEDHSSEVTFVYAAGPGTNDVRPIYPLANTARMGVSPFSRREFFVDASNTQDADQLETEARTALHAGRARKVLSGRIVDTDQMRYGLHYNFGDLVVAEEKNRSFEAHINAIHGTFEKGVETLDNRIIGEAEL